MRYSYIDTKKRKTQLEGPKKQQNGAVLPPKIILFLVEFNTWLRLQGIGQRQY
jgi:hypothetical protein